MDNLQQRREDRHIAVPHIAAFIGINPNSYWDLEGYSEDIWSLRIIEFLRLCVAFRATPKEVLPPEATTSNNTQNVIYTKEQYGIINITKTLSDLYTLDKFSDMADAIGWEKDVLQHWLSDDYALGQMPLPALHDLCNYLAVSMTQVLTIYWEALGCSMLDTTQ